MTNPFKLSFNHNLTVFRKAVIRRSFAILGVLNTHYKKERRFYYDLSEWKKLCDQKRSGWSKDTLPEEKLQHVIVYPADGSLPHPDTCRKWVVKYVNRNNFDHITPHDFRHFYTTYLLTKGVDIKTVAKMAGHQDETTTLKIYTAITKEGYDKAVAVLNAV